MSKRQISSKTTTKATLYADMHLVPYDELEDAYHNAKRETQAKSYTFDSHTLEVQRCAWVRCTRATAKHRKTHHQIIHRVMH